MSDTGFEIVIPETRVKDLDDTVYSDLLDKVDKKNRELEWIKKFPKLPNRFHNFFGENDFHIAELSFESRHRRFRALCIVLPDCRKLVFWAVVQKEDGYESSDQKRMIKSLLDDGHRVKRKARELTENL